MSERSQNRRLLPFGWSVAEIVCAAVILVAAAFLRFWRLGSAPGWEWDEPNYTNIAMHVLHGHLEIKENVLTAHRPYLFHPPFYFWLLAGWFRVVGSGIVEARALIAGSSLIVLGLAYLLLRRRLGMFALIPIGLLAVDGWMVFSDRTASFDHIMLVIGLAGILVYDRALSTGNPSQFAIAGLLLGGATVFKHVGAYLILAVALHWLLTRRYSPQHLLLMTGAAAVVTVYVAGMLVVYDGNYSSETGVQIRRAFGFLPSGPSIQGIGDISPVLHQYRLYYGTIVVGIAGLCLFGWRVAMMISRRSTAYVRDVGFAFSWLAAALIFFAALQIRFPQYFMMVLVPMYIYVGTEAYAWLRQGGDRGRLVVVYAAVALISLDVTTFYERIATRHDNALKQVAAYAKRAIPPGDIVLTEEPVGTLIPQRYCETWQALKCGQLASWLIVYQTPLFKPSEKQRIDLLRARGQRLAVFKGFKETISVYKLPR